MIRRCGPAALARVATAAAITAAAIFTAAATLAAPGTEPGRPGAAPSPSAGLVRFAIEKNGVAVAEPQVDIAIRARSISPPKVVAQGVGILEFELEPGRYDCIVTHTHTAMRPLRFHRFTVAAGETTEVRSDLETFTLTVHFVAADVDAPERVTELTVADTKSGEFLRQAQPGTLELPRGHYRIRIRAHRREARGVLERETTLFLGENLLVALSE